MQAPIPQGAAEIGGKLQKPFPMIIDWKTKILRMARAVNLYKPKTQTKVIIKTLQISFKRNWSWQITNRQLYQQRLI